MAYYALQQFLPMFLQLFTTFSFLFWICLASLVVFITVATESDHRKSANLFVLLFVVAFWQPIQSLFTGWSITSLLACFVGYVVLGSMWTVGKWFFFVRKIEYELKTDPPTEKYPTNGRTFDWYKSQLSVARNKWKIIFWGMYWPASILWTLTSDLAENMFLVLRGWYERIANPAMTQLQRLETEYEEKQKQAVNSLRH